MVVSPNPNLLLLVQLISPLADTFDMFLIQSGILARGVEVEAMDVSEGPPPQKRASHLTQSAYWKRKHGLVLCCSWE